MSPVPDTAGGTGLYAAVRQALEDDLDRYRRWEPPPIKRATLAAMDLGERVEVPSWALPSWARLPFTPGDIEPMAIVGPDDRLDFRAETGKDICDWHGLN
jgi:hypothetical protein